MQSYHTVSMAYYILLKNSDSLSCVAIKFRAWPTRFRGLGGFVLVCFGGFLQETNQKVPGNLSLLHYLKKEFEILYSIIGNFL